MSSPPGGSAVTRMLEGSTIALDSIRANKVRASLTILGVAIGVTVVIAMASAITGINRSITGILESAGPKTFFVYRYFSGGLEVSDGSDEMSPWRRMPRPGARIRTTSGSDARSTGPTRTCSMNCSCPHSGCSSARGPGRRT